MYWKGLNMLSSEHILIRIFRFCYRRHINRLSGRLSYQEFSDKYNCIYRGNVLSLTKSLIPSARSTCFWTEDSYFSALLSQMLLNLYFDTDYSYHLPCKMLSKRGLVCVFFSRVKLKDFFFISYLNRQLLTNFWLTQISPDIKGMWQKEVSCPNECFFVTSDAFDILCLVYSNFSTNKNNIWNL